MGILKNFLKKNNEIENDYDEKAVEPYKPKKGYQQFTPEDYQASAETRRAKAELRRLQMEAEKRRLLKDMEREEFSSQIEMEERLERLKGLKVENLQAMSGGEGASTDAMLLNLVNVIMSKQNPMPQQPQATGFDTNFTQEMPQTPITEPETQEQEYAPSRFTDEQMKEKLKMIPQPILAQLKGLEEQEVLQAYDILKTL